VWPTVVATRPERFDVDNEKPGDFGRSAARDELGMLTQPRGSADPLTDRILALVQPILDRRAA
jgi:hypothetical protein